MRMKLQVLWLAWFIAVCLYSFLLAGIVFRNLYTVTFDQKLKDDIKFLVLAYKPTLAGELQKSTALSMAEYDIMHTLDGDKRIAQVIYIDGYGNIRWHPEAQYIGESLSQYQTDAGQDMTIAFDAAKYRSDEIRLYPKDAKFYEMAFPFFSGSGSPYPLGVLYLLVDRQGVLQETAQGMVKYRLGSLLVALLIGAPLYFFLFNYVIRPLESLQEAVDGLSLKNLEWTTALRADEFGDLGSGIAQFVDKVKAEVGALHGREAARGGAERQWWNGVFSVMSPGTQAIVVDEDNNVLFTNIAVNAAPGQRMHLLDIVDSQQQDILRLVGVALERPNDLVQGETLFQNRDCRVRIVHLGDDAGIKRTLIYFEPKRQESEFPSLRT